MLRQGAGVARVAAAPRRSLLPRGVSLCYDRRIMNGDELTLVEWLRARQRPRPEVELGIGDDMAVIAPHAGSGEATARPLLMSSDMLLDGVHFDAARHPPARIGHKAVACSLSDKCLRQAATSGWFTKICSP